MQCRRFRKSRKMRKSRKIKGGYPTPINVLMPFTVSNVPRGDFRPRFAFERPNFLKEIFISAVFEHIHADDPVVDLFSQNEEILEDEHASVQIHRIRGTEDTIEFDGNIKIWEEEQIKNFVANIQEGDRINIEPITMIE